ncbi:hypothetical protein MLD52_22170 [Puniceicoccaceae bacterium K14]|nr:hypothetical protein [Puniceicoccaceae bacterium K14]
MPDWFYRTVAQKSLFSMPGESGRTLALGVIGTLGRFSAGRAVIDFMGHMSPDPRLSVVVDGVVFPSRIGLGWRVDPNRQAAEGLSRFGVGCIEFNANQAIDVERADGGTLVDVESRNHRLASIPERLEVPRLIRSMGDGDTECLKLPSGKVLRVVPWDFTPKSISPDLDNGLVLQVGVRDENGLWSVPCSLPEASLEKVRYWKGRLSDSATLIVSGSVGDPEDALRLVEAGADLVLLDAALVFKGPGLVKRCNEALLQRSESPSRESVSVPLFRRAWVWGCLLGASLFLGGLATFWLAMTNVLLPYDESFLGMTSEDLRRLSPKLFDFMAHDRGTLAGTMLGLGWMYLAMARCGVRRGVHGAQTALVVSAATGFASFFSFFGFGYFDTLHAFVALALLQLTIQVLVNGDGGETECLKRPIDREDSAWRRAQWGQLVWILHAVGLLGAGGVILIIGMTSVFVSEDLSFLCMTAEQAKNLDTRMIGVVAHDRATLGGMLLASGVAMLLSVLWLYRRGGRWLWKGIFGLGLPAYSISIGIHLWVGYTDLWHLVPALLGALLWAIGLCLSKGFLFDDYSK